MIIEQRVVIPAADGSPPITLSRDRHRDGLHIQQGRHYLSLTPSQLDELIDGADALGDPKLGVLYRSGKGGDDD